MMPCFGANRSMLVKKKISLSPIEGLRGRFATEGDRMFINLVWDRVPEDDRFLGYIIYANYPPDTSMVREAHLPLLQENRFSYPVSYYYAQTYRFSVSALYRTGNESVRSDIYEITVPTLYLPKVVITNISDVGDELVVRWMYSQTIPDLEGFNIYINGQQKNNAPISITQREFIVRKTDLPNNRATIGVSSVTVNGVESSPAMVTVSSK